MNKSIEILMQNNIFNAKEFMEELTKNKLSMKPEQVELLLNLDKGSLFIEEEKESITSIIKLKDKNKL